VTSRQDDEGSRAEAAERVKRVLSPEAIDALITDAKDSGIALDGQGGLLQQMMKQVIARALQAELADHLGYEAGDPAGRGSGNNRNGSYPKTVTTTASPAGIEVPRDRRGEFEPRIAPKGTRRLGEVDKMILSLYARGMTTRDITARLYEVYGAEVSPALVSKVTTRSAQPRNSRRQPERGRTTRRCGHREDQGSAAQNGSAHRSARTPLARARGHDIDGQVQEAAGCCSARAGPTDSVTGQIASARSSREHHHRAPNPGPSPDKRSTRVRAPLGRPGTRSIFGRNKRSSPFGGGDRGPDGRFIPAECPLSGGVKVRGRSAVHTTPRRPPPSGSPVHLRTSQVHEEQRFQAQELDGPSPGERSARRRGGNGRQVLNGSR
jgi:hypothetical protein